MNYMSGLIIIWEIIYKKQKRKWAPKSKELRLIGYRTLKKLLLFGLLWRKRILFGSFSSSDGITFVRKRKAWDEIIDECKQKYAFDAVAGDKDYKHLRDHVWGDLKGRVMEKRDRLAKTGAAAEEWSKLENLVLEAVGAESAAVGGLPVREQWDPEPASLDHASTKLHSGSSLSSKSRSASTAGGCCSPAMGRESILSDDEDIGFGGERTSDQASTSGMSRVSKRPLALSEEEKKKEATLRREIMCLQKQNLILQNQKLLLEIEALKRNLS